VISAIKLRRWPTMDGVIAQEFQVEEEGVEPATSVERKAIWLGSALLQVEEVITSAGTADRKATWLLTVLSLKCAEDAAKKAT